MKSTLGILATFLGLLSLVIIAGNYIVVWKQLRAKPGERTPSLVPIAGGLSGVLAWRISAMAALAQPAWLGWALWAPLIDPGCYLIYLLIMTAARKIRGC